MKATNQTKQVHVVTIEIDDPAEVAALRAELTRHANTTGGPELPTMVRLAKVVVEAIKPKPTTRGLSYTEQVMSGLSEGRAAGSQESSF